MLKTRCVYMVAIEETIPEEDLHGVGMTVSLYADALKVMREEVTDLLSGEFCGKVTVEEVARDAWREEEAREQ